MPGPRNRAPEAREIVYRLEAPAASKPTQLPLLLSQAGPGIAVETSVAHLDDDGLVWRILNVHGPAADVKAARKAFAAYKPAFLVEKELFGATPQRLILWYKYRPTGAAAASQTALAFRLLGRDTVVTDSTRGRRLTIRILARNRGRVAEFLRQAREAAAGLEFELLYLGPPRDTAYARLTTPEEETLGMAWERGYFSVPGKIEVRELASNARLSPSTVSYRLRRAVAKLVAAHVQE